MDQEHEAREDFSDERIVARVVAAIGNKPGISTADLEREVGALFYYRFRQAVPVPLVEYREAGWYPKGSDLHTPTVRFNLGPEDIEKIARVKRQGELASAHPALPRDVTSVPLDVGDVEAFIQAAVREALERACCPQCDYPASRTLDSARNVLQRGFKG